MDHQPLTGGISPTPRWGARFLGLGTRLGRPEQAESAALGSMAARLKMLSEMLLIVAGCEGVVILVVPWLWTESRIWQVLAADLTTLTLVAGPLLLWRIKRGYQLQDAWQRLELRQRMAELNQLNTKLQDEICERERAQWFLNSVIEHLPFPVFLKEFRELRFVHWNKAGEQLTGIPNAEMIGKNSHDILAEKDAERNIAKDRAVFEKQTLLEIPEETVHTRKHGVRIVHVWKVPIFDPSGQPAFLLEICEDITERKRAAMALQQSEERFRLLVEESPDMIGIYQEGKLVFINSTGIRLWGGNAKEELLGRRSEQLIHPEDHAGVMARIRRRLAGERGMYPAEVRYLRKDGTTMPMEVSAAPVVFEGQPAVQFIAHDITERELAQRQLRQSERRLRLILESVPECIKLVAADGTLLEMNSAGLAMVEADHLDQVLGLYAKDLLLPKYRPMFEALNAAVFRGESKTAEYELVGRKGTRRWLETYAGPLRDGEGRVIAQLGVTRDITQRRQAEELLRLQEAALRSAANVVLITDWQGLTVWVNPAFTRVTGYTAAEVLGQHPWVSPPGNQSAANSAAFFQDLRQTISGGAAWHGEFCSCRKDGTPLIEDVTITPVQDEKGEITHFVAVKQDITERKRSEAELVQAQKEIVTASRLAGMAEVATGVLHNVGNVLNSVNIVSSCMAETLRKSEVSNLFKVVALLRDHEADLGVFFTNDAQAKQVTGYLAQLVDHVAGEQLALQQELFDLQHHIDHLKEIVRMQQSLAKAPGNEEVRDLTELVEEALRLSHGSLAHNRLQVIREFEAVSPIRVEKHKVLQILVNLLQNAGQACQAADRDDQQVTVRLLNGADRVCISVSDNGVGIPRENLTRVFNHGFTTKEDGHGFGLHNAANAAREMGGNLKVHSEGPGQGATFTLELSVRP